MHDDGDEPDDEDLPNYQREQLSSHRPTTPVDVTANPPRFVSKVTIICDTVSALSSSQLMPYENNEKIFHRLKNLPFMYLFCSKQTYQRGI